MTAIVVKRSSYRSLTVLQSILVLVSLGVLLAHIVIFIIPYEKELEGKFKPLTIANGIAVGIAVLAVLYTAFLAIRNHKPSQDEDIFQLQSTMFSTLIFTVTVLGVSLSMQYMYRNFKEGKLDSEDSQGVN